MEEVVVLVRSVLRIVLVQCRQVSRSGCCVVRPLYGRYNSYYKIIAHALAFVDTAASIQACCMHSLLQASPVWSRS